MRTRAKLAAPLVLLTLPLRADAWGFQGHNFITANSVQHLPDPLKFYFQQNLTTVNQYASNEPPGRHYIDIDYYPEWAAGTFPHDENVLIAKYGLSTVQNNGESPWTIGNYRVTLTQQMQAANTAAAWVALGRTAGEMAHYIEDAHQPLHVTQNYDGQFTGNSGVHSRYETTMVNQHLADLTISLAAATYIPNMVDAVFDSFAITYPHVNHIMAADTVAAGDPRTFGTAYYNSMWTTTGAWTHTQFQDASEMVASAWYSAWVDAGSPAPIPEPGIWVGGAGNWSDSSKWSASAIPNSATMPVKIDGANAAASTVTLNQSASVGRLTLDAADTLIISSTRTLTISANGATTLAGTLINNGALVFSGATATISKGGSNSGSFSLTSGAKVTLAAGGSKTLKVASLSIAGATSALDLSDNKLIVTGGAIGSSTGGTYTGLSGLIQSGLNSGAWDGGGIVTRMPDALSSKTTLAIATADQTGYAGGTFGGISVASGNVLLMYTYAGDANLSGSIDPDDYALISFNDNIPSASGYFNGDFNYDGTINADDFALIDFNFNAQGAPFPTSATAQAAIAVPEPGMVAALSFLSGSSLALRRRRLH